LNNAAAIEATIAALGDDAPLIGDGRRGPPDRREVSARWLSGTFLTGLTSCLLMGVAIFVALEGRQQLATPPEIARVDRTGDDVTGEEAKMVRLAPPPAIARASDRKRMEVSTLTRSGDKDIVRMMPFMRVTMALAAGYQPNRKYPPFDPSAVAADNVPDAEVDAPATTLVVGYKVESDVSLKTVDFPADSAAFDESARLSAAEVEEVVRTTAADLSDGAIQVAALHYVDPQRFGTDLGPGGLAENLAARILHENVSVTERTRGDADRPSFAEDVIPVRATRAIGDILDESGYRDAGAGRFAEAIAKTQGSDQIVAGSVLRLGVVAGDSEDRVVRASLYQSGAHLWTIAIDDSDQIVFLNDEPERNPAVASAFDDQPPPLRVRGDLPSVYDGIYRAAYSYGMTPDMTKQMVRMFAADVDYQARISPTDRIEAFFSHPDDTGNATADSELLYVQATFSGTTRNFYRFRMKDGSTDFFDENGRSSRQFMLRKAVPAGVFRSGFGMRRHPILGYYRMHTGIDWSAPTGTPIIAVASGVVEKAGWSGGYGKQTIIRHTNGYETSYSHQSRIAGGVVPGARVRQGQIIGYVGTTGLSTGAHLHFELIVNGTKVDPMRVRLPTGKVLKGPDLEAFKRERERIDALLGEGVQKVADARS